MSLRKGQRVEFVYEGKRNFGVVSKGGSKKVTVVIDGAKEQISSTPHAFRLSDVPLPIDSPNVMDKWSVKKYEEIEGHGDSSTFHAHICLNGKVVIEAMNDGWGGSNVYQPLNNHKYDIVDKFRNDAKEWAKSFGYTDPFEIEDIWIEWYVYKRPYGVTGEMTINEMKEKLTSLKSS